ncbi:MAG: hypothetical protein G8345_19980, partial [Magnetococcales bacterium]|nr:hypothetical protein [Magnetococcales bacterium]NGZ29151.1 hypothetical protein [Magnetococcales bacterium]
MKRQSLIILLATLLLAACAPTYGVPVAYTPDGQPVAYSFGQYPVGLAPGMPVVYA